MSTLDSIYEKLIAGGLLLSISAILAQALGFVHNIVFAQVLSATAFGQLTIALTIVSVLGTILQFGLGSATRRYLNEYLETNQSERAFGTILFCITVPTLLALIFGLGLYFGAPYVSINLFNDPELEPVIRAGALLLLSKPILDILASSFQGYERFGTSVIVGALGQNFVKFVGALAVAVVGLSVSEVLSAMAGLSIVIAIGGVALIFSEIQPSTFRSVDIPTARLLTFSLPLFLSTFAGRLLSSADYFLIGGLLSTEAVGQYRPAFLIASVIPIGFRAFNQAMYPTAVSLLSNDDRSAFVNLLQTIMFWSFALTIPIFLWTVLFATEILLVFFGPAYQTGATALVILAVAMLVDVILGPVGALLELLEHTNVVLVSYIIAGTVNIVLNLLLIPRYLIVGAAVATAVSLILLNSIQYFAVRSHIRLSRDYSRWFRSLGIATFLVTPFLLLSLPPLVAVVLSIPYFLVTFALTVWVIPLMPREEQLLSTFRSKIIAVFKNERL
ncbi:flippase [Haladaptatus sp. ZSTT2]|uniref:flippase n=1 Tax=Haladaptatus sp. ZSTT2 TaxID=3120515 RepID=UPI00300F3BC1